MTTLQKSVRLFEKRNGAREISHTLILSAAETRQQDALRNVLADKQILIVVLIVTMSLLTISCGSDLQLQSTTSALIAGSRIEATVTTSVTPAVKPTTNVVSSQTGPQTAPVVSLTNEP